MQKNNALLILQGEDVASLNDIPRMSGFENDDHFLLQV
jgi:hypothetical protein